MQAGYLTRRFTLLLPLALAACGGGEQERVYEPLRYNYLPPIQLNVASIKVEQRFIPAGLPPDVSNQDPVQPIEALKAMANDRLQAFGTANTAIFSIMDASLTRVNDVITGSFAVSLTIQDDNGTQLGYAQARVDSRHTGPIDDIRPVLYDMTKSMMSDMNVEFEYQIRRNLKNWLTSAAAPDTPVEQAPLNGSSGDGGSGNGSLGNGDSGTGGPGVDGSGVGTSGVGDSGASGSGLGGSGGPTAPSSLGNGQPGGSQTLPAQPYPGSTSQSSPGPGAPLQAQPYAGQSYPGGSSGGQGYGR